MKGTTRVAVAAVLATLWAGCATEPTDETPGGALTLFLRAMDRSQWDADARAEAYRLMSPDARASLDARASMATSLGGREFAPWEMIPQGRFRLKFNVPTADHMQTEIDGDRAVITIFGASEGQEARVPMVREDGAWRVELVIPPMRREGSASEASQSVIRPPQ